MRSMDAYRGALTADNATHDDRARQRLLRLPALAGAARLGAGAGRAAPRRAGAVRQRRRGPEWLTTLLLGLGLVAIIEGLALALAPARMREALEAIARMDPERRRLVGLLAVTVGIALVWASRA